MRTMTRIVNLAIAATGVTAAILAQGPPAEPLTPPANNSSPAPPSMTPQPMATPPQAASKGKSKGNQPTSEKDARAPYIIGPEDTLNILVWDNGALSGPVTVGPDGMISLPLIDEVKADGLTTEQLKVLLTKRLAEGGFIRNPEVTVRVQAVRSRRFTIQGEVGRPGTYPLTGPTTMLEAMVYGGGFRDFANKKRIYILRKKPDGGVEKLTFNWNEVSKGKHMEQNILVQNGDQIFVP